MKYLKFLIPLLLIGCRTVKTSTVFHSDTLKTDSTLIVNHNVEKIDSVKEKVSENVNVNTIIKDSIKVIEHPDGSKDTYHYHSEITDRTREKETHKEEKTIHMEDSLLVVEVGIEKTVVDSVGHTEVIVEEKSFVAKIKDAILLTVCIIIVCLFLKRE